MSSATAPPAQTEELVERLFAATIDTLEIASVHLGGRLGFYRSLADGGDATPGELAARTGTAERYVREWLEQQAVAGFLTVETRTPTPGERRYGLPAAYRAVFVEEENLNYLTPLATLAIGVCAPLERCSRPTAPATGCRSRRTAPISSTPSARSTGRSSSTSSRTGSPRCPRSTRACGRAARPRRRCRLRDGLVEHRDRPRLPRGNRRRDRRRRRVDRDCSGQRRGRRPGRSGAAGPPRRQRPGARRPLRPGHDLRGPARHEPSRGGAAGGPGQPHRGRERA